LVFGLSVAAATARGADAESDTAPVGLLQAAEQGTFNIGAAQATLRRSSDSAVGHEVVRLDYVLPEGATVGLWTKAYPPDFRAANVDLARLGLRAENPEQLRRIAVSMEIKGTAGTQRIALPLEPQPGWTFAERTVDWQAVGQPTEVVIAMRHVGGEPVAGVLWLDGCFDRLSAYQKLGALVEARLAGVLLVSLLGTILTIQLHASCRRWQLRQGAGRIGEPVKQKSAAGQGWLGGVKRDFVAGSSMVLIAGLGLTIYFLGDRTRPEAGWIALAVAIAGAAIAEWLKHGLTGKHLTPAEVFQDMSLSGLLAACASPLVVLQAPGTWSDAILLSQSVAAIAAVFYHLANAYRLASSGEHLGIVSGALIALTPFGVGGLPLLESASLMQALGGSLTAWTLVAWPAALAALGRMLVVFGFNEAVANGLSLAAKRRLLKSPLAHLTLLAVAAGVVVSPWIADFGSGAVVASWPTVIRLVATLLTTVLSQAGLWAEVYLITGMLMHALLGKAPSQGSAYGLPIEGMKKGMVYSGAFMGILYGLDLLWQSSILRELAARHPLAIAALLGAVVFPLAKTVIETFDGNQAFFRRLRRSYRDPVLYARGAVVGLGLGYAVTHAMAEEEMLGRVKFGLGIGILAFAGVSFVRDSLHALRGQGRPQSWRVYLVQSLLGGFIGAAIGFYLDAAQVSVVVSKYHRYLSAGQAPEAYGVYPFLSKWGFINLGQVTGGVNLLFAEALAGVISWAVPAWLFAINRTVMVAYFRKDPAPLRSLFSRGGLVELAENMLGVLRWGLWMSPVINSFLRPMGDPTWYNQDGAIRTLVAIFQDATMTPAAFRDWSLQVFVYLLAYDVVRVLIWLDHMGLRVATLVNLSFLGMDRLDERLARFLGPAATARCIPEGVKRFTTWAPLLIPFYIPRGQDWNQAWNQAEALRGAAQAGGLLATLSALPLAEQLLLLAGAIAASTAFCSLIRWLRNRFGAPSGRTWSLGNSKYEVVLKQNGEVFSHALSRGYDVSRRSYDLLDPAGRALFLVDAAGASPHAWPVMGNYPRHCGPAPQIERTENSVRIVSAGNGLRTTLEISLPGDEDPAELWTITVENLTGAERHLKMAPYLEWVLDRPSADRGHSQYNRLFPEMEYVGGLNAVLAWNKHSKAMGLLAADCAPEGFLTSRIDFIGRARSLWSPRVLETLAFSPAKDTAAHPTFDPIGSLLVGLHLKPNAATRVRLLIGLVKNKNQAIELIARHLRIPGASQVSPVRERKTLHAIRHGEIPPGTPQPYSEFSPDGRTLLVRTPFTPRPYDHTMSNRLGHVVVVTNRGLHTTSSGNSQQNRLTPDWPDIVTREVPAEAFYLYDPDRRQWFSPTYHPLNDPRAAHEVQFSVDGSATYHMTQGTLSTELTVFVPPEDPTGVYLLTVRNHGDAGRRIRLAPYFQMVLASQPEHAGPLKVSADRALNALFFENPRNGFRSGPAFAALSCPTGRLETRRGRFFGAGRDVARPFLVEQGEPDVTATEDDRPIAGFLATLAIPAHGECTVAVVLGQADNRRQAEAVIRKYQDPIAAHASLQNTRKWWLSLMDTVRVATSNPEFDHYLDWLKYQGLAERIWARRGFYQASGAFGFRDQLQDSVNLMWMDPVLARRQILLHARQQFTEGDVVHWFHLLQDGRTGFAARTHASDNLLWLPWAVAEYVAATGDDSILDEHAPYLEAEQPFAPLPAGKHGTGFDPLRSSRTDSVYRHCMKAIDLVLERRMGAHGLPLIGTGDWNDGLDEIGSQGKGESVWLGFFLYCILDRMAGIILRCEGCAKQAYYQKRRQELKDALELTWREDRYLRAIHDDGTEIGVKGSGVWEIDALTAAWAVISGINPERGRVVFDTAVGVLEKETTILLGYPALHEDTKPYLGRSSRYPEGVRENGMYSHGVQWLVGAARILAEQYRRAGDREQARRYRETAWRLWRKISPIAHVVPGEIETYGGQPNKQAADMLTTFDPGRMIWHGYTGAAGWLFRQALEGVLGARLAGNAMIPPADLAEPIHAIGAARVHRDPSESPLRGLGSYQHGQTQVKESLLRGPTRPKRLVRQTGFRP
jgi:cyclic beta-1,2-glucan synthetase